MRQKISWTDGRTDRGKTVYPPPPSGSGGYKNNHYLTHSLDYVVFSVNPLFTIRTDLKNHKQHFYLFNIAKNTGNTKIYITNDADTNVRFNYLEN